MNTNPIELITQQRDAFLDSASLDPAWTAGWHAAVDHTAHVVRAAVEAPATEEATTVVLDDLRSASDTSVYIYDTDDAGRVIATAYTDDGHEQGRYLVGVTLVPLTTDSEAAHER